MPAVSRIGGRIPPARIRWAVLALCLFGAASASAAVRSSPQFRMNADGLVVGAGETQGSGVRLFSVIGGQPAGASQSPGFRLAGGSLQVRTAMDSDGDGWPDDQDNCPADFNDQTDTDADGLGDVCDPDADNDGVGNASDSDPLDPFACRDLDGDSCDDCSIGVDGLGPSTDFDPNNDGPDQDADGLCDAGDPDDDDDGFPDGGDNCPLAFNPSQADADLDGVGNLCDPQNQCGGLQAVVQNLSVSGSFYCAAEERVTAGGVAPPGVQVESSGHAVLTAPLIELVAPFSVVPGGVFAAGGNEPAPGPCVGNDQCPGGSYCQLPAGLCGGEGLCELLPLACPPVLDPVCGCDGLTYGNACDAGLAGVSISHLGACLPP